MPKSPIGTGAGRADNSLTRAETSLMVGRYGQFTHFNWGSDRLQPRHASWCGNAGTQMVKDADRDFRVFGVRCSVFGGA